MSNTDGFKFEEWSIAEKNLFVDSIIKTNCNLELIQTIIYSRTFKQIVMQLDLLYCKFNYFIQSELTRMSCFEKSNFDVRYFFVCEFLDSLNKSLAKQSISTPKKFQIILNKYAEFPIFKIFDCDLNIRFVLLKNYLDINYRDYFISNEPIIQDEDFKDPFGNLCFE